MKMTEKPGFIELFDMDQKSIGLYNLNSIFKIEEYIDNDIPVGSIIILTDKIEILTNESFASLKRRLKQWAHLAE